MQDYKTIMQVLELRVEKKLSRDKAKLRCKLGNGTYQLIEERFNESGKTFEELKTMKENDVVSLIYPEPNIRRKNIPLPDYESIHKRVNFTKVASTLFLEWLDYKKDNPDGYQYTQFVEYYNRFVKDAYGKDVSMAVNRVPGEKVFIDWVGDKPKLVYDSQTGVLKEAHFFVTSVGVSNMIFVKAYENEKLPNFIDGTKCALEYYGAVPKYLVPDNLKTAINKHTKDELIINAVYEDLENHYGVIVLPPPAYKPKGYIQKKIISN